MVKIKMNRYIQKLIQEQFSISDLDFSDDEQEYGINIFNKKFENPYYQKVLDGTATKDEIKIMNSWDCVTKPEDKNELQKIIKLYSKNYPCDSLNWLDVSDITDMRYLFAETRYNGDISKWDTSSVTDMNHMFYHAELFNQPIGSWDVHNVNNMSYMFFCAEKFNQHIDSWDVSSVTNMNSMFFGAYLFNKPINQWDVKNVTNMCCMFQNASSFNQSINNWDVSNVIIMDNMFYYAKSFNQDIHKWNISNKAFITGMFQDCPIKEGNKPLKCRRIKRS